LLENAACVVFNEIDLAGLARPDFPDHHIVVGVACLQLVLWERLGIGDRLVREGFKILHRNGMTKGDPWHVFPALGWTMAEVAPAYGFEADAFIANRSLSR